MLFTALLSNWDQFQRAIDYYMPQHHWARTSGLELSILLATKTTKQYVTDSWSQWLNDITTFIFKQAWIFNSDWSIHSNRAHITPCVFCVLTSRIALLYAKWKMYSVSSLLEDKFIIRPQWIWDAEALYFSVFHSRLCDNLYWHKLHRGL